VTSNAERCLINLERSVEFTKRALANQPVVVFGYQPKTTEFPRNFNLDKRRLQHLYATNAQSIGIFAKGAPACLNESVEPWHNPSNGKPGVMHSITFGPNEPDQVVHQCKDMIAAAAAGEIVFIPLIPSFINIELPVVSIGQHGHEFSISLS
jgi:hypothetical protein